MKKITVMIITAVTCCLPALPRDIDISGTDPAYPPITIIGDAPALLNGKPAFFRGFADPSIRKDPDTDRLWMAYSWPYVAVSSGKDIACVVDIHLAHSDDGGRTWTFDKKLFKTTPGFDKGRIGGKGYMSHEVASLFPHRTAEGVRWYCARLCYQVPVNGKLKRNPDSFRLHICAAKTPMALSDAEDAVLGGSATAKGWNAVIDLVSLFPEYDNAMLWNEPSLFMIGDTLYLTARSMSFHYGTSDARKEGDCLIVFSTKPAGDVRQWRWRYCGRLAGMSEAAELGGESLTQIDIARAKDGALIALMTPTHFNARDKADEHLGLRVLTVASLDTPKLARDNDGRLIVRAAVTASDLAPWGPAASGYDASLARGIIFVRRVWDRRTPEMVWTMHNTGIHP